LILFPEGASGSDKKASKKSKKEKKQQEEEPIPEPQGRTGKAVNQVVCDYDELEDGQYVF